MGITRKQEFMVSSRTSETVHRHICAHLFRGFWISWAGFDRFNVILGCNASSSLRMIGVCCYFRLVIPYGKWALGRLYNQVI